MESQGLIFMKILISLYKETFGEAPSRVEAIAKAGSNRHYFRLYGNPTVIGVVGTSVEENRSFIYLARHFKKRTLPVPEVLAVSLDETCYLQEDLGTLSLFDSLHAGREAEGKYGENECRLVKKTIRCLPHFQIEGIRELDKSQLLSPAVFTKETAIFDFNYFKYCFLRTTDVSFDEVLLQADFESFAEDLAATEEIGFLYRDFQARNVILKDGETPSFIDFQGGKVGPLHYDVVSFLWQASAKYSSTFRDRMIDAYLDELSTLIPVNRKTFRVRLQQFALFRMLQVLGAYGLRGRFERKKHFLDSIPPALENVRQLLSAGACRKYEYLERTLRQLLEKEAVRQPADPVTTRKKDHLVIRIFSFRYKRGIPEDESGNGGGYVFDCRSTHNPGRYKPYKKLTGLDEPVIRFLEKDGEILDFLKNIYPLADHHVERYLKRGFTDLMFSFGCTGGQHRSVYAAQHLAEHLHRKYGVEVWLVHREQKISSVFERKNS